MEQYPGVTYSDSCQTAIMTKTPATFPDPDMTKIIPHTGAERPNMDAEMTYLENNNIDKAIRQRLSNKDVYEIYMHNIYNLIVGQTNKQLQEKVESDVTFQAIKTGRDFIQYMIILKKL